MGFTSKSLEFTQKVEAGGLGIQGHPWLPSELSQGKPGLPKTQCQKLKVGARISQYSVCNASRKSEPQSSRRVPELEKQRQRVGRPD